MRSKTTLLTFFLFLGVLAYGQQPAQYSLYMMNQLNWNPGYAGLEHSLSVTGGFREQWVGLAGKPPAKPENSKTIKSKVHHQMRLVSFCTAACAVDSMETARYLTKNRIFAQMRCRHAYAKRHQINVFVLF